MLSLSPLSPRTADRMINSSLNADVKASMEKLLIGDLDDDSLSLDCIQKLKSGKDAPAAMLSYLEAYRYR